ncbi:membrane ptm1 [Trichoderma arundinaceum]|uniref:Membrane ptm1 n=1 Tax=Trichoderma arundinaceum TaxID=490622 RepID=A0A395NAD8_TRIAR|nr:membrane ptm1 [Trichoderma arundinaceum]
MAVLTLTIMALLCRSVLGIQRALSLDQQWANHQRCIDMNGENSFQPTTASSIVVTLDAAAEGVVSVVVFELGDEHLGGIHLPGSQDKEVLCDPNNVERKLCTEKEIGAFLISDHARAKAKHPMITRAVNLTKPIAIVYPVQGPGYFCVATYGYSAKSYSGILLAMETNSILPAFREKLRVAYIYLMPLWAFLSFIWARLITDMALTQPIDPSISALGIISMAQVTFRWGGLQLVKSNAASVLQIVWYCLELGQNFLVMCIIHELITMCGALPSGNKRSKFPKRILSYAYLAIFSIIFVFECIVDSTTTVESTRPTLVNILIGSYLLVGAATAAFVLARQRPINHELEGDSSSTYSGSQKPLAFVLAALCILIIAIVIFNTWAILKVEGDGVKFAHMFWHNRFGLVDMPYEPLFLVLVVVLLGLYTYQAQRHEAVAGLKNNETEGLMSYKPVSMESTDLAGSEGEEEK